MIVDVTIDANFRSALDARDPDKANRPACYDNYYYSLQFQK